jgi:hypothetical protein
MPKEFYTEKDIEDLFQRGVRSLQITDNIILTELAYEKAKRLNVQLVTDRADNPPAAPVRPYISEQQTPRPVETIHSAPSSTSLSDGSLRSAHEVPGLMSGAEREGENEVESKIRSAVIARLGNQVDAKLLDNIIHRVVKSVGLK